MLIGVRDISAVRRALAVVGQHAPAVHPRQRGRRGAGQPDHLQQPRLRRAGRAARVLERACPQSPSPTCTSAPARPGTSWPTRSSWRSTTRRRTARTSRATTRAPAACSCRPSSPGPPSPCAWATSICSSRARSRTSRASCSSGTRCTMAQTAAPFLTFDHNPYAVINSSGGHDRLGRRRLHDHGQLRLLAERGHPAGGGREQPARQLQLRAQLGQGRHRRLLGEDDVLRRRPAGPDSAGVLGGVPEHVHADFEDAGLAAGPPALPAGHLLHSVRHLRALPPDQQRASSMPPATPGSSRRRPAPGRSRRPCWPRTPTTTRGSWSSTTPARMAPQYQVYSLPGTDPDKQVFTVSDGFVPASQANLSNSNQNFNLTAWMVGLADPGQYGQLNLYEVPQGTAGPANADAEISANKHGVVGHHAARPARLRGPAGGDAHGPDRPTPWSICGRSTRRRRRTRSRSCSTWWGCSARRCRSTRRCRPSCPTS